jgi:hypothetical protein
MNQGAIACSPTTCTACLGYTAEDIDIRYREIMVESLDLSFG